MAVNRHRNHLVVYLEDQPYRGMMNGVKKLLNINAFVIDVRPPCGGWSKVFAELRDNLLLLNNNPYMHGLLLTEYLADGRSGL